MKQYSRLIGSIAAILFGLWVVVPIYAVPNFGNFAGSTVEVQTQSNSGDNSVTLDNGSNANNNSVSSGNSSSQTTVCTFQNTNGANPNCLQPTAAPTVAPTVQPTPTPTPGNGGGCTSNCGGGGGGSSSSNSSGSSSSTSGPSQAVLGASTFAGTGTFENTVMEIMFALGMIVLSLGGLSYAKEKKN